MKSNAFLIIGLCLLLVIGFTHKLNAQGKTLGWVKQMGGTGNQNALGMTVDKLGNTYYTGPFDGTADFDPGVGKFEMTSAGTYNVFVVKLDIEGRFQWAKRMGGAGNCQGLAIAVDDSGNVFTTGFFTGTGDFDPGPGTATLTSLGGDQIFITKLDQRGNFVWAKQLGASGNDRALSVTTDATGNVLIGGYFSLTVDFDPGANTFNLAATGSTDIFVCKLNAAGDFMWAIKQSSTNVEAVTAITSDAQGNVITTGYFNAKADFNPGVDTFFITPASSNSDVFISKLDASGNFIWAKAIGSTSDDRAGNKIHTDASGNIYLSGHFNGTVDFNPDTTVFNLTSAGADDAFAVKLDSAGKLQWAKRIGSTLSDRSYSMAIDKKGNSYLTGYFRGTVDMDPGPGIFNLTSVGSNDIFVTKLDRDGNFLWAVKAGGAGADDGNGIVVDYMNGITITGRFLQSSDFGIGEGILDFVSAAGEDVYALKIKQPSIWGRVYNDFNQNCLKDSIENGIPSRNVLINPGNYITQTNLLGTWSIDVLPSGNYTVFADSSGKWSAACGFSSSFTVVHPDSSAIVSPIGLFNTQPCSRSRIALHMPRIRRCFNNNAIYVTACNDRFSSGMLRNAYAEVELDSLLSVVSASIPFSVVGSNLYRFELDTLFPGDCKNFTIVAQTSCASRLGQSLCMRAKIFPVEPCAVDTVQPRICPDASTTCNTGFDGSNVVVKSRCVNDSVYLSVKNENPVGNNDMSCPLPVNIFRDGVLIQTTQVQLNGGDSIIYKFPGDGRTWRIGSTQHPKHPRQGCPNSTIEACGDSTNWTPDLVNILPVNEVQDIEATYCGIVTGSYDPNDKTGFPLGVTANHFIAPNQQMEYLIRFQNTGNDTAFTVVIRDTLDTDFDIFTVRSGVASHAYDFRMYGQRILEWTFNNILLPDSATNEPASNGFVKFTVQQNKDLPDGTEFNNRVGIYFDFNDPIITNTTSHIINRPTFTQVVSGASLLEASFRIVAYPNPTSGWLTLKGLSGVQSHYTLRIKNLMGAEVLLRIDGSEDEAAFNLSTLPNGIYFIELAHANGKEALRVVKQ